MAVWKNDRLGRNRADLLRVKQAIRMAGARLKYIEGFSPTDDPDSILVEGMSDAFAEYYSRQLSANIRRGVAYNAQNALANGRKIYGYRIDAEKKYQRDDVTGPIVESIFADYVAGKTSQAIADDLNASGARTLRGFEFTPKTLQKILKHRAYIGSTQRCLIDGREGESLTARTDGGRLVRLTGPDEWIGTFRPVTITDAGTWSMTGRAE